jgi:hypothetical protein
VTDREWEVVVVPLVVGQRSVREKEWLETLKIVEKDLRDKDKRREENHF